MVGAALRAKDGRVYTGCNVENASFTPTSCAERTALFKAVADGVTEFTDIAVVGSRRGEVNEQITSPCGVCRQALFEFGGPELNVIMAKTPEDFIERSMDELLPFGSGLPMWPEMPLWKNKSLPGTKPERQGVVQK